MANAYLVPPAPLPSTFELPRDMQTEVLRHTAASFAVDWLTICHYDFHDPADNAHYRGSAVAELRYEFKLERRRATAPRVLRARFTRRVCPFFKTTDEWRNMPSTQQTAIENHLRRTCAVAPFSELRVLLSDAPDDRPSRFYFVRSNLIHEVNQTQFSPPWSQLYRGQLLRVRDKLRTICHMDVRDQPGQLLHTPTWM